MMISRSPRAKKMNSSDDCSKSSAKPKRICAPRSRNCRKPAARLFASRQFPTALDRYPHGFAGHVAPLLFVIRSSLSEADFAWRIRSTDCLARDRKVTSDEWEAVEAVEGGEM